MARGMPGYVHGEGMHVIAAYRAAYIYLLHAVEIWCSTAAVLQPLACPMMQLAPV